MSVQTNESYNRCLDELRNRYKGRGISASIKNDAMLKSGTEDTAEKSYILFESKSNIADCYRSGVYNGSKYMTSDDFVRYFKTRREFYMPEALRKQQEMQAKSTSVVSKRQTGRGMRESSDSKEGHLKAIISALKEFQAKWLPLEPSEGRAVGGRFRIPVAAMSGLAVFTISLGLIVGGSVMIGSASGEVGRLNSEISVLEATEADLEGKLDLKYNVNEIEDEARSLGMIKREHADNKYVPVKGDNEVIIYEDTDKEMGLAALLSAFGIEID